MKYLLYTFFLTVFISVNIEAQPPAGDANTGDSYGAGANITIAQPLMDIVSKLNGEREIPVTVKAKVLDVCPKKGCWLKLAVNDSTTAFVKMKDYAFFLPVAIKGKNIVLSGTAFEKTTSEAELKHYAEDAKKSPAEIAAITGPKKEIRFIADGITVVE